MKHTKKLLAVLGAMGLGAGFASADSGAMFSAKSSEATHVTIGGHIAAQYQWVDVNDNTGFGEDPCHFNNFLMPHIRLFVAAELGECWSAQMNVDFVGKPKRIFEKTNNSTDNSEWKVSDGFLGRSFQCADQGAIFVDKAYIQRTWLDATFRVGYQKVYWGIEEQTPETQLKTVERSVATNFFMNAGRRHEANNATKNHQYFGHRIGSRHTGVYLAGQVCDYHYGFAVTNGFQGLCLKSDDTNNELNFYASLATEFTVDCMDFLIGVNGAYAPKGGNRKGFVENSEVFGFNPYLTMSWNRLNVLAEFFWARVCDGRLFDQTNVVLSQKSNSNPWGVNIIPSYTLNECWEVAARFSYVNSDKTGMTIHDTFKCTPDDATSCISSDVLYEKVYAGYIGFNRYFMNGAVKATVGYEQARYQNAYDGTMFNDQCCTRVDAIRAQLQFVF